MLNIAPTANSARDDYEKSRLTGGASCAAGRLYWYTPTMIAVSFLVRLRRRHRPQHRNRRTHQATCQLGLRADGQSKWRLGLAGLGRYGADPIMGGMSGTLLFDILVAEGPPGAGSEASRSLPWLAQELLSASLAELGRLQLYEQRFVSGTPDHASELELLRSIFQMYAEWAKEAEQVLARIQTVGSGEVPPEDVRRLDDAIGMIRARLTVAPERIVKSKEQARQGQFVPAKEMRDGVSRPASHLMPRINCARLIRRPRSLQLMNSTGWRSTLLIRRLCRGGKLGQGIAEAHSVRPRTHRSRPKIDHSGWSRPCEKANSD